MNISKTSILAVLSPWRQRGSVQMSVDCRPICCSLNVMQIPHATVWCCNAVPSKDDKERPSSAVSLELTVTPRIFKWTRHDQDEHTLRHQGFDIHMNKYSVQWDWWWPCWFVCVGDCLLDQPQRQLSLPDSLPGSTYSLHRQCELAFGPTSKPCPYMQPCSKLWCTGKARGQLVCQTRHFPWADGTSCGSGKVCYEGACSEKNATMHIKVSFQNGASLWREWARLTPGCRCRWMVAGGSGGVLGTALGLVAVEFSRPKESVTTPSPRTEGNTATGYASNTAPVTSTRVLTQVKLTTLRPGVSDSFWLRVRI